MARFATQIGAGCSQHVLTVTAACNVVTICVALFLLRMVRKNEMLLWHHPEVYELRRRLTIRAYVWLGLYTATAVWINLCYVFAYDTPTIWCVPPICVYGTRMVPEQKSLIL